MKRITSLLLVLILGLSVLALPSCGKEKSAYKADETGTSNYVEIFFPDYGSVVILVEPTAAPITVANFLSLVDSGFYNGLTFHRIIPGFMIQGGDPAGNGNGSSPNKITGEFSQNGWDNPIAHVRGTVSMARATDVNSASCQFFICHDTASHLDGQYAAFGRVVEGMDVVDAIVNEMIRIYGTIYAEKAGYAGNAEAIDYYGRYYLQYANGAIDAENQPKVEFIRRIQYTK